MARLTHAMKDEMLSEMRGLLDRAYVEHDRLNAELDRKTDALVEARRALWDSTKRLNKARRIYREEHPRA